MLPVVVGAFGTILNATKESLKEMKFSKIEIKKPLRKLQNNFVRGMVKICAAVYSDRLVNDEATISKCFI